MQSRASQHIVWHIALMGQPPPQLLAAVREWRSIQMMAGSRGGHHLSPLLSVLHRFCVYFLVSFISIWCFLSITIILFFARMLNAEKLSCYGDGEGRLCLCWVKTVAGEWRVVTSTGHHQQHSPDTSPDLVRDTAGWSWYYLWYLYDTIHLLSIHDESQAMGLVNVKFIIHLIQSWITVTTDHDHYPAHQPATHFFCDHH